VGNENVSADRAADAAAIAAALWQVTEGNKQSSLSPSTLSSSPSRWKQEGRRQELDRLP
jgi:hypothetical protein